MRIHDLPTDVYVDMTMKGSISYLMTSDTQQDSKWTHILMAENSNTVYSQPDLLSNFSL